MKRLILVIFCVLAFPVWASHIVGGEFEILHVSGSTYRVNFILYFDLTGNLGAKDDVVHARIYRKRDNAVMRDVSLPLMQETPVSYTQPECSIGQVKTSKIVYTTTIQMPPAQYSDPQGYYIVWERCCRNYNTGSDGKVKLVNIVSVDPQMSTNNPNASGQTFYLEFPPVVKNGQPFINSSPQLFPPLSDYACIGKPYYTDFAGTDVDGDSLVYTLVTPLNTHTSAALPFAGPGPAPYPYVKWKSPYHLGNIVGGSPDLTISEDGLLTVTPGNVVGLYVFAVKCEEFRKGQKIGELRRDFQMYVLECPVADPPVVEGRTIGAPSFVPGPMNVSFANTVPDSLRYIEVRITDPDVDRAPGFSERITRIRAIPIGFKRKMDDFLKVSPATLTKTNREIIFKVYFKACPLVDGPFTIGIIAEDDACALPLMDTLRVNVNIEMPPNNRSRFITLDVDSTIQEGQPILRFPIKAYDTDGDDMILSILPEPGSSMASAGMNFITQGQQKDTVTGISYINAEFTWDPRCNVYDFRKKTQFLIKFLVEDGHCGFHHFDTLIFKLRIILPGNSSPVISTDLSDSEVNNGITRKIFQSLTFNVFGKDTIKDSSGKVDNDLLVLSARGKGFNMSDYGVSFPSVTDYQKVQSKFTWNINCDKVNIAQKSFFEFEFIVVDNANKCRFYKADTLTVKVNVEPPDNKKPKLIITNTDWEIPFVDRHISIELGQEISLGLAAYDADNDPVDKIVIELAEVTGNVAPKGYVFAPAEGFGSARTTFLWNPDCSIFSKNVYENNYTFKFRTTDNRCANAMADTVELDINIKDIDGSDTEFLPPNIITPNADGCNDFFAMEGIEEINNAECADYVIPKLPLDNCAGRFSRIFIYNRWGKEIFSSGSRSFRWHALNEAAGVYFYTLQYTNKEYKGSITVSY